MEKYNILIKRRRVFILILACIPCYGQYESGILFKHTIYRSLGWNGSHAPKHTITIGDITSSARNSSTTSDFTNYDFCFINNGLYEMDCFGSTSGNRDPSYNCEVSEMIAYNTTTFDSASFQGCVGETEIMGIHLKQPIDNSACIENTINLGIGYHWQYSYSGIAGSWTNFPTSFQGKRNISFKINELSDYVGKTRIYFRTGYGTQFTNAILYNIIRCSPKIIETPLTTTTKCNYSLPETEKGGGSVTFTFDRKLEDNEKYLFTANIVGKDLPISAYSDGVYTTGSYIEKITDTIYEWKNIPVGSYNFEYQTLINNSPSTDVQGPDFEILKPDALEAIITETQPKCNGDAAGVTITASGGTSPYYYTIIDGIPKTKTIIPIEMIPLQPRVHNIKVEDAQGCVDTTP